MSTPTHCPRCKFSNLAVLGSTGYRTYYHCLHCNWQFSAKDHP